jgi:3-carboxy-cis,cis-muconate cycloisomerase
VPWHTARTRIAELAAALGEACGVMAKVAGDVVLLSQTEVGEVREGGEGGGSSTMPHKRNPVAAVSALAGARQAPGLVATLLAAMEHEHERAAGAWHAEWAPLRALLIATGSAAAWLRDCLEHLEVDPERMRANLDGAMMAERVAGAIGRDAADEIVRSGRPLAEALGDRMSAEEADRLLDPASYLGATDQLIDRALAAHGRAR